MTFNLLESVKHNSDKNQQGCAAEELGKALIDVEISCECREDCYQGDKQGTGQRNAGHYIVKVVGSILARLYAWNEAIVALQLICHLNRVESNSCVEICKGDNQYHEYKVIQEAIHVKKVAQHGAVLTSAACHGNGDKHQCLGKDDRHYVGSKQLDGDILTCTTYLLSSLHALGVLYRHLADGLNQENGSCYHDNEGNDLEQELNQTTGTGRGEGCYELPMIPIIMIMDTPLPTPLSVIRSPSHRMNMLPAARMMVEVRRNIPQGRALLMAPAAWV